MQNESLDRLAPNDVQVHLMILDDKGAGRVTVDNWRIAYELRAIYEAFWPGKRFCIRHTDCLIY